MNYVYLSKFYNLLALILITFVTQKTKTKNNKKKTKTYLNKTMAAKKEQQKSIF